MTETEVTETIMRVANQLANKYKFAHFEADDIIQEAFILALDALESYNPAFPLENFIRVHLSHRLKSFKRDNYVRATFKCTNCSGEDCTSCKKARLRRASKKNLFHPIDIAEVDDEDESNMSSYDGTDSYFFINEIKALIDKELESKYREDYVKMCHGVKISKIKAKVIKNRIKEIAEKYGYTV